MTVLLVDDQAIVGEAVRRMLAAEAGRQLPLLLRPDESHRAGQRDQARR